jgi:metallophosphoesterase superfamily enzyme
MIVIFRVAFFIMPAFGSFKSDSNALVIHDCHVGINETKI